MKKILLSLTLAIAVVLNLQAQAPIPNGSFEEWEGTTDKKPVGWDTVNATTPIESITLKNASTGEDEIFPAQHGKIFIGLISNVRNVNGTPTDFPGIITSSFPYTDRPSYIAAHIMYFPGNSNEVFAILVKLTRWDTATKARQIVLEQEFGYPAPASRAPWKLFTGNLTEYQILDKPDTATITIISSKNITTTGTILVVDNLKFTKDKPTAFGEQFDLVPVLGQNSIIVFPNPTNTIANIKYSTAEFGRVSVTMFDITGRNIKELENEVKPSGEYNLQVNTADFTPGIYFVRMRAGDKIQTRKVIITR